MKSFRVSLFLLLVLFVIALPLQAQDDVLPEPTRIELTASGDAVLIGDFYTSTADTPQPALLLMHQYQGRRGDWSRLLPTLIGAGYNVLAVDLRGHGDSGRPQNWTAAQDDTQLWLGWLLDQPTVDTTRLGIIGASIGSNLALVGCVANEACVTSVALSPGMNYFDVMPEESLRDRAPRSVMLVASHDDRESASTITQLAAAAGRRTVVGLEMFVGSAHGTTLLLTQPGINAILAFWLERAFAVET